MREGCDEVARLILQGCDEWSSLANKRAPAFSLGEGVRFGRHSHIFAVRFTFVECACVVLGMGECVRFGRHSHNNSAWLRYLLPGEPRSSTGREEISATHDAMSSPLLNRHV